MSVEDYYPAGSYYDPEAPWNETDVPEKDFDVTCSQSLSRTVAVTTNNYIPGASGVDYEPDGEGGYCASGWHDPDDTSDTNWAEEYQGNNHYTPIQLIELYRETLKCRLKELESKKIIPSIKAQISSTKHLIEECSGWTDDETEFVGN